MQVSKNLYFAHDDDCGGNQYIIASSLTKALTMFILENKYEPEIIKLIDKDILMQEE